MRCFYCQLPTCLLCLFIIIYRGARDCDHHESCDNSRVVDKWYRNEAEDGCVGTLVCFIPHDRRGIKDDFV